MKRRLRVFLASVLILSITGCAGNQNAMDPPPQGNQEVQQGNPEIQQRNPENKQRSNVNNRNHRNFEKNNSPRQARVYDQGDRGLSQEYHGHISNRPETKNQNKGNKGNPPAASNRYISVQLLGINDLHGQLNVTRRVGGRPVGRVDYLSTYLKQRAAENEKNTLLVHAGDMIGASPPVSALLKDEPTIEILNQFGMDVGTVGNHEFDKGVNELMRLLKGGEGFQGANFPWVVSNVIYQETGEPILPPYKIIRVNGMPIGFIGVCLSDTPSIVIPSGVAGLKFTDEAEAINRYAAELKRQGVRSIVVLAHNPASSSQDGQNANGELVEIAKKVDDEVDILFGGHNHAYLNATVDGKLLVQSYAYATAFSDVDIQIDPKTKDIVSKKAEIITTFQEGVEPDSEITQMVRAYEDKVGPIVNRIVGNTSQTLTKEQNASGESALGNLIADAQRAAMNTDFAFMNPGGIRADIEAGEITWGELYTVQPFNNMLVKMTLTGQQVRDLLNQQFGPKTRMLQISGLTYTWDDNQPVGNKIVDVYTADGTSLDPNKDYTLTVNNFMAGGGDNYTALLEGRNKETGPVDIDALVEFIEGLHSPFSYSIQGRVKRLDY